MDGSLQAMGSHGRVLSSGPMGQSVLEGYLGLKCGVTGRGQGWSQGGPGRGCGSGLSWTCLWFRPQLRRPRLLKASPQNSERQYFHKSAENFLPSHPSFQTCFLLGLQTCSHSSYLLPLSLTSECLLWLPLSPVCSLLRLELDAQQKTLLPASRPRLLGQGLSSLYFK